MRLRVPNAVGGLGLPGISITERSMGKEADSNHGEGNPEAAEEFNSREQAFVSSSRGKKKIEEGAQVRPEEEASLAEAEQLGRERAKGDDPDTARARKQ
jgi:hypothetical protein